MASFSYLEWDIQYKKGDDPVTTRTVGIEFEGKVKNSKCLFSNESIRKAKERWVAEDLSRRSYDFKERDWVKEQMKKQKIKFPIADWGRDGGDKEFVTHPDSINFFHSGGSKRFKEVMAYLDENTMADVASGTHIHIGYLPSDDIFKLRNNLYWMMMAFGEQVQKIFGRRSTWAKIPEYKGTLHIDKKLVEEIAYPKPDRINEYDIDSMPCKGSIFVKRDHTIEFRGPKATHNIKEVLAWVQFCYNMVEACSQDSIMDITFASLLKGTHIKRYVKELEKSTERQITLAEKRQKISRMTEFKYFIGGNKILK